MGLDIFARYRYGRICSVEIFNYDESLLIYEDVVIEPRCEKQTVQTAFSATYLDYYFSFRM